eukprot:2077428-Alexandrium_andersonii.AAC.1
MRRARAPSVSSSGDEPARRPRARRRRTEDGVESAPPVAPPMGTNFRQWLYTMYASAKLTAQDLCTAAWAVEPFASQLGVAGL